MEKYSIFIVVIVACLYFAQGSIAGRGEDLQAMPDASVSDTALTTGN